MADIKQCKEDFERKLEELKEAVERHNEKSECLKIIDGVDNVVSEYENYFEPKIIELIEND